MQELLLDSISISAGRKPLLDGISISAEIGSCATGLVFEPMESCTQADNIEKYWPIFICPIWKYLI